MEEIRGLIASIVAFLAKREREEACEYDGYAYAPVRVAVRAADELERSGDSVTWRMY